MIDNSRESKHNVENGLKKLFGSTFELESFDCEKLIKLELDDACQAHFAQFPSSFNLSEEELVDKADAMKE